MSLRNYDSYLVTAALPYANGPLHIGHLAGCYIASDVYVRYLRLFGKDVVFVCGSDEHGAAITIKAQKEGVSPKEIIDKYHGMFQDAFQKMKLSFDIYHRTSAQLHHETSQDFFQTLHDKGVFETIESEQYYDEEAQQFLADRYIQGECPNCQFTEAYGDQCENCGSTLSPTELINPISKITGSKPTKKSTTHWYLPLNKDEDWIREWIETGKLDGAEHHDPSDWKNHVIGQCKSWLDSGLHPRAMTRDLSWGVDVPQSIPGSEGKKLYVWLDAPIGYISATKQWAADNNKDWEKYWKNEDTALVHFLGKDNIVFHCLIFPSILKAHGGYNLPINVPANQFMNLEGNKLSTSRNWAVWVHEYLQDFPEQSDALRYCMVRNMPEQKDSEFTWKSFQEANNNELVNNLGNFIQRVMVLVNKYYDGKIPEYDPYAEIEGSGTSDEMASYDGEVLILFDMLHEMHNAFMAYEFRNALNLLMKISSSGNQLLQNNEPWKQIKDNPESVKTVMTLCSQYAAALCVAMRPFLPDASDQLRAMLGQEQIKENGEWTEMLNALAEGTDLLAPGHQIQPAQHLFSRIEDEVIDQQIEKLHATQAANMDQNESTQKSNPIKDTIAYDDFVKLDLRTATIIAAEPVPKTDKLLKLELDLGFEKRTVVSGIAGSYKSEDIIGKQVTLLANLAPRKIRGVESNGMILMASNEADELCFVNPDTKWANGSNVS